LASDVKKFTQKLESNKLTLLTYIKCLTRKMICFLCSIELWRKCYRHLHRKKLCSTNCSCYLNKV